MLDNDPRVVRERLLDLGTSLDSGDSEASEGAAAILGVTATVSSYPTVAGAYYAMYPVEVDGTPSEGVAASYSTDATAPFYAYNAGSKVPDPGTRAVASRVGGRWTFAWNG